jgi:hypothetical protein
VRTDPESGVTEFREVELVSSTVTMVIVPTTGREVEYAAFIEAELEAREIRDRRVFVVFDATDTPLSDKVAAAAARDRPIIIVNEQDAIDETATLQMPDENDSVRGLDLDELFDRLDRRLPKPSFEGIRCSRVVASPMSSMRKVQVSTAWRRMSRKRSDCSRPKWSAGRCARQAYWDERAPPAPSSPPVRRPAMGSRWNGRPLRPGDCAHDLDGVWPLDAAAAGRLVL